MAFKVIGLYKKIKRHLRKHFRVALFQGQHLAAITRGLNVVLVLYI